MNKNEIYETEITGITDDGSGVGRVNGVAVFVPYALIGETVRIIIVKVQKSYAIGKLLEVMRPSKHRVKAQCEFFYKCGGCQFWNVDYGEELKYKQQKVEDCLKRIGGIDVEVKPVLGAESVFAYRNKGQFPVRSGGIGIYANRSHRVIDIDDCLIQDKQGMAAVRIVREWMNRFDVEPYDEEKHSGAVRHIYTRTGKSGVIVCIVTSKRDLEHSKELVSALRSGIEKLEGVLQNINSERTNVVLGKEFKTLWGKDYIIDSIGKFSFKISPLSFYQVNSAQTKVLYDKAAQFAGVSDNAVLWDLYCGTGTIGQYIAGNRGKIVGVEIVSAAIENAKENARINGIENAEYFCAAAESVAPRLVKNGLKPDVIVLDPPRKGCERSLLEAAAKIRPKRIVYISCKPSTLARDLKILSELGHETKEVQPVDMFPRTCHVETVVLLQRQNT